VAQLNDLGPESYLAQVLKVLSLLVEGLANSDIGFTTATAVMSASLSAQLLLSDSTNGS
jgi:hypothetical protein